MGYPLLQPELAVTALISALMNPEFQKRKTVVVLGDKGVGKTTLIKALKHFGNATPAANPPDIHEVTYKQLKFTIVDAGGDSTRSVTPNTIRYARAVLLTYDITKHETLDSCKHWHQFALQNCKEDTVSYALVGCKSDLRNDRDVAWDTAERVSNMINANKLLEVSGTRRTHCDQLMEWLHGVMKEATAQDDVGNDDSIALAPAANNPATEQNKCWRC